LLQVAVSRHKICLKHKSKNNYFFPHKEEKEKKEEKKGYAS
jgi:hypothetical protein